LTTLKPVGGLSWERSERGRATTPLEFMVLLFFHRGGPLYETGSNWLNYMPRSKKGPEKKPERKNPLENSFTLGQHKKMGKVERKSGGGGTEKRK